MLLMFIAIVSKVSDGTGHFIMPVETAVEKWIEILTESKIANAIMKISHQMPLITAMSHYIQEHLLQLALQWTSYYHILCNTSLRMKLFQIFLLHSSFVQSPTHVSRHITFSRIFFLLTWNVDVLPIFFIQI